MTGPDRRQFLCGGLTALALPRPADAQGQAKIDLWDNTTGPHLRGAVLAQRRVIPSLDGPEFLGPGPVGAPVSDAALRQLAASGANLAVLSHPGPRTVAAPYAPDPVIMDALDSLVRRCEQAGLFVVIGFRAGPGRSEFTFHRDSAGDWFPAHLLDEHLWRSEAAGDAWVAMWRDTAIRFRHRHNVAGYLLMVEPNANLAAPGPDGGDLDIWEPDRLARIVAGTPADWPALAARMARGVRDVDADTPVLVSPDGYANARFERLLALEGISGTVLAIHDYAPRDFTHQDAADRRPFQPGEGRFQLPSARRWMLGEFGASRWSPGASAYLAERIAQCEAAGASWSYFRWDSGWSVYEAQENRFNPVYGADPSARSPVPGNPVLDALEQGWAANRLRPRPILRR